MLTYSELLQSEEWKIKREKILLRDNFRCQRCGIGQDFNYFKKGPIFDKSSASLVKNYEFNKVGNQKFISLVAGENKGILICKTNLNNFDISGDNEYVVTFQVGIKGQINYSLMATLLGERKPQPFDNIACNAKAITKLTKSLPSDKYEIDKEGFWLILKNEEFEFLKSKNLHVHHKCYRHNIEIWNQNDNEYLSLCNICHRIIHETFDIPYFDSNGFELSHKEVCSRCLGQRYFECYRHRDNGICYRCNGSGIEN